MEEDVILKISHRIKEARKELGITLQELADRAGVSKGLISQIENNRTVPSLLVLIDIVKALEVNLDRFFKDISAGYGKSAIVVKRKTEYASFEQEGDVGVLYKRILNKPARHVAVDVLLVELEPEASRPMRTTEAFLCKYVIAGTVRYSFADQEIDVSAGDSLLFDGRLAHTSTNSGKEKAILLMASFLEEPL